MHGVSPLPTKETAAAARGISLSVVVPCFNESECVGACYDRLARVCSDLGVSRFELIFVNDGSTDGTLQSLQCLRKRDPRVVIVDLARNYGHQTALSAGLSVVRGERILVIDADLQDPPELLGEMMAAMDQGADVAYGQRRRRDGENWFKIASAKLFYRVLSHVSSVHIPPDVGDFRLMSRQVVDILNSMPETHRFIRGMVSWIGFNQVAIQYERASRFAGETKYPLAKMVSLASDAMTAFALAPLRFVYTMAFGAAALAVLLIGWSIYSYLFEDVVPGWSSLMVALLTFSAVQLFAMGIIGEYIGRIFIQVKGRPLYIVKQLHRD
ncbi:glycosyltransferase family 2 protein [Chelatococcus sp. GCM10030263]|uniref:glycosyltransferase family 2 protein n=1 Tax=Chelatococcus sp. GCM10030263 TaxID=3273387 RepID=UPI00361A1760